MPGTRAAFGTARVGSLPVLDLRCTKCVRNHFSETRIARRSKFFAPGSKHIRQQSTRFLAAHSRMRSGSNKDGATLPQCAFKRHAAHARKLSPSRRYSMSECKSFVPHIVVSNAAKAIDFYKQAFGAIEVARFPAPGTNKIMHAY